MQRGVDGQQVRQPLRSMPRLHGLHYSVPLGSPIRQADRSHSRADRAQLQAPMVGPPFPPHDLRNLSPSNSTPPGALSALALSKAGTPLARPRKRLTSPAARTPALHGISSSRLIGKSLLSPDAR